LISTDIIMLTRYRTEVILAKAEVVSHLNIRLLLIIQYVKLILEIILFFYF